MAPMSPNDLIGAIDQGTTGTRFVIFDAECSVIGDGFVSHTRHRRLPDRVEYDPEEIWTCTRAAIQEGIDRAGISATSLRTLGIANQRQTTLIWDRLTGEPLCPAISWQDRRSSSIIESLTPEDCEMIQNRSGLVPDAYFAGPTLAWLLDHGGAGNGELRERAKEGSICFGTIDSWLLFRLTDQHATDISNAAQSMLFNIHQCEWDPELLRVFNIPEEVLPVVHASSDPEAFGESDVAGLLDAPIPITGVLGNQQAALVGQLGFATGTTKVSYGSGNFALQNVGNEPITSNRQLLSTIWFQQSEKDPLYGLEGPILTTGTTLEWLEETGLVDEPDRILRKPDSPQSPRPTVIPAVGGLGAPDWGWTSKATIIGLSTSMSRESVVRGTIDGIGFSTRWVLDRMETCTGTAISKVFVDGGAISDDTFATGQAALLGRELQRNAANQTAALGAAIAAGLAVNTWKSIGDLDHAWVTGKSFRPQGNEGDAITERYQTWNRVRKQTGRLLVSNDR